MARSAGRFGNLYVGLAAGATQAQPVLYASKMTIAQSQDSIEVTGFADTTNRAYLVALPDNTISFEGFWDDATSLAAAASDGTARPFYAYIKASYYAYGNGFISKLEYGVPVDGAVSIKGEIVPSGAVTFKNI